MLLELEESAERAWPAAECEERDGWRLCFNAGFSKRANSVHTHRGAAADGAGLAARIAHCERRYARRGLRCIFKLSDATRPRGLDAALERRGYALVDPTSVQVRPLGGAPAARPPEDAAARLACGAAPSGWLEACAALAGVDRSGLADLTARIRAPRAFAFVPGADGTPDAVALGVRDGRLVGILDVATAPRARGRGLARRVVEALLDWAGDAGARHAWLQVVAANTPARLLYRGLGFAEAYRYWYRVAR